MDLEAGEKFPGNFYFIFWNEQNVEKMSDSWFLTDVFPLPLARAHTENVKFSINVVLKFY